MLRALCLAVSLILSARCAFAGSAAEIAQSALGNIFTEGEHPVFPVRTSGDHLRWRVTDFFGSTVASGDEAVSQGGASIAPGTGEGYFTLDVEIMRNGQKTGEATTVFAVVPRPRPPTDESPFGVMTHFAKGWGTDVIPLIGKAGIAHVRDEQPWRQVERLRGEYRFNPRLSDYMAALSARHLDPLVVLAFANPLYDRGMTPYTDEGRAAFAAYADAVVQTYKPFLREVEIWNEYNGSFCQGPCRDDRPAFYVSMLREAYQALKSKDPFVTVLGGAAVPIPLEWFHTLFDLGALQSMDALVIHPYRKQPEGAEGEIAALRQLMSRYGSTKPIWATEFSDLADMRKSRDDVARYLVRMSTVLLASGVERLYWYLLRDYDEFAGLGLLRDEGDPLGRYTPTPAFAAYATLIDRLGGAKFLRREPSDPEAYIYTFSSDRGDIRVAWSTSPDAVYRMADGGAVRIGDMMGGEKILPAEERGRSVTLGRDPIYIVGAGAPSGLSSGSPLVANSVGDFSLDQGGKGWSYAMIVRPDGKPEAGAAFGGRFVPLQPNSAGDAWRSPESPTLKIKSNVMHPGRSGSEAAWAVRRWTSASGGVFRVSGAVELGDRKASGVTVAILADGRVAYVAELGGGAADQARFDLKLAVSKGGGIDFAVGPAADGAIDFDATRLSAAIRDAGQ